MNTSRRSLHFTAVVLCIATMGLAGLVSVGCGGDGGGGDTPAAGAGGSSNLDAGDAGGSSFDAGGSGGSNLDASTEDGASHDAAEDSSPDADDAATKSLVIDPSSYTFDKVQAHAGGAHAFTISNKGPDVISGIAAALDPPGGEFSLELEDHCNQPMAPGASCTATVTYQPTDTTEDNTTLRVTANNGIEAAATIKGVTPALAPGLTLSPVTLDFGTTALMSTTGPKTVTVTNTGSTAVNDLRVGFASDGQHTHAGFSEVGHGCLGISLAPSGSCKVNVVFQPDTEGVKNDTLEVSYDNYSPATASLTGQAVKSDLSSTPTLHFDDVNVNDVGGYVRSLNITNNGASPVGPLDAAVITTDANDGAFTLETDGCVGKTLTAHASCSIDIMFKPTARGKQTGEARVAAGANFAVTKLIGTTRDIWVDATKGSPSNDGLSKDQPVDTLTQALTPHGTFGWTIHVAPGVYSQPKEVFPIVLDGQTLVGDSVSPPEIKPTGSVHGVLSIHSGGGFISDFVIDASGTTPSGGSRKEAVYAGMSSGGGSNDDARLSNVKILLGKSWDGVHAWGGHSSTQFTVTNSTITCTSGTPGSFAFKAQSQGLYVLNDLTVVGCEDGVIAAGGISMKIGHSDLSKCTGDSIRVEGNYSGAQMIDLGLASGTGYNNLSGTAATHVGISVLSVPGNGIRLKNNTWRPSVQGANASGHYGSSTKTGPVPRVGGNNYALAAGTNIQFL